MPGPAKPKSADITALAARVERWFIASARTLPWRTPITGAPGLASPVPRRDPYHALVAEAMLQQTQVSRVIDKFSAFIDRFPTVTDLARADEDAVLSAWSGLGYYRRARNLHAAAKLIVERFDARVPHALPELLTLPGVGRYTAGAIASIAYNQPAPIVDGNVARVLLRIHGVEAATNDPARQPWLWQHAQALVSAAGSPALLNEGLMELGATVCLPPPAAPACESCPISEHCRARATNRQSIIPTPKPTIARSVVHCATALITRSSDGAILVEQRPPKGMWAGLWQAPTLESAARSPTRAQLAAHLDIPTSRLTRFESFEFLATHRRLLFTVYHARHVAKKPPSRGQFLTPGQVAELAISSPQSRILLAQHKTSPSP